MSEAELSGASASLGKAYAKDTTNKATALRYANVLQISGQTDQALAVMRKLAITHPKDREVLAAYGKALAGVGQLRTGARRRAPRPDPGISGLAPGLGGRRDPRSARRDGAGARTLPQGARPQAQRSVGPVQSRHVLRAGRRPEDGRNLSPDRLAVAARPTAGYARTSRSSSASRAASRRPSRSPARNCRPTRRRPTSPICARCWPSRTPGTSSRPRTRAATPTTQTEFGHSWPRGTGPKLNRYPVGQPEFPDHANCSCEQDRRSFQGRRFFLARKFGRRSTWRRRSVCSCPGRCRAR